jgi:hypothetical protein
VTLASVAYAYKLACAREGGAVSSI